MGVFFPGLSRYGGIVEVSLEGSDVWSICQAVKLPRHFAYEVWIEISCQIKGVTEDGFTLYIRGRDIEYIVGKGVQAFLITGITRLNYLLITWLIVLQKG